MAFVVSFKCHIVQPGFVNMSRFQYRSNSSLPQRHRLAITNEQNGGLDSDPDTTKGEVDNLGVRVALSALKFYKREISPALLKSCRYVPTCSEYAMEAYKKYGFCKGTVLTVWRICRCNPLGGSGFDPPRWFGETSLPKE